MSNLDMSLDDIIERNKKSGGGPSSRGRGRNSGAHGPARRSFKRGGSRAAPYPSAKVQAPESTWDHDMFTEQGAAYPPRLNQVSAIETGTKLYISNLDYGVSNEDIKELFSEVGDVKRYSVHYDRSGRSKGTAEVIFSRRKDAEAALKRYNNVQLDGNPMKIEIIGTNIATPSAVAPTTNIIYGNQNGAPRSRGRGGVKSRLQRGGRGMRRGREQGRGNDEKISVEDLDADLDKYHEEAMQTN